MLKSLFSRFFKTIRRLFNFFFAPLAYAQNLKIIQKYLELAKAGDKVAQFKLVIHLMKEKPEKKKWPEIINWLTKSANSGLKEAQTLLGLLSKEGYGVLIKVDDAISWFEKAAELGDTVALIHLAAMENEGTYIPKKPKDLEKVLLNSAQEGNPFAQFNLAFRLNKDPNGNREETINWYRKASDGFRITGEKDDVFAQYHLGLIFKNGLDSPKNPIAALGWFQKAANHGFAKAQFMVGLMHLNGEGVKKNHKVGLRWLNKAAEQGLIIAKEKIETLFSKKPSAPFVLPKKPANALEFLQNAANLKGTNLPEHISRIFLCGECNHNDIIAQTKLFAFRGPKTPSPEELPYVDYLNILAIKNHHLRVKNIKKAAKRGNLYAQTEYAMLLSLGDGVPQNFTEAANWYSEAAEQGDAVAQNNLALIKYHGYGVPVDKADAFNRLSKAAYENENPTALLNLGIWFLYGDNFLSKNFATAFSCFKKAEEKGYPFADFYLGVCYAQGKFVSQNPQLATDYFKKACEKRVPNAFLYLGVAQSIGFGCPADIDKGKKLILQALELKIPRSLLFSSTLLTPNFDKFKFCKKVQSFFLDEATSHDDLAQYNLGLLYILGEIVNQNLAEGVKWLKKAATQENMHAQNCLGLMLANGKGVLQNYAGALLQFKNAAINGHIDAHFYLSIMYLDGLGVPQAPEEGIL
ncbi:MAG: SEL1-like repeat protein, partial [Deltaproteobacteria bacterium]|nr:SEL1-like repeat protein [Deltaproteobacteria bacterium]